MKASRWWARLGNAYRRRAARWLGRRMVEIRPSVPLVSFTFDDFPRSAAQHGGAILRRFGFAGTYYTAFGLEGTGGIEGDMFVTEDLVELVSTGHELGCHTYDHCPAWETRPRTFEASVRRNAAALEETLPGHRFRTLSYPISYPRPNTKRRMSRHFSCCRGGGQTHNQGRTDANCLRSFFLEQAAGQLENVKRVLDANRQAQGWLIFSTHDVVERPSPYGVTPDFFTHVVELVAASGARVLPVYAAWTALTA